VHAKCDVMLYTHGFDGGGAERVMVMLANYWAEAGAQVVMVTNVGDGPLRRDLSPRVAALSLDRKRGLLAAPALGAAIRDRAPRALVSSMTEQNITACFARRILGRHVRVITVEQNFASDALARKARWRRVILPRLMRAAYPAADAVTAVSQAAARDLEVLLRRPEGFVRVLHNPVWPLRPDPDAAPAELHPWLAGPDPVLLNVGRLVPQKNHRNLLEALAIVRAARPVRLLVLGDGPLRAELEARATALGVRGAVDFLGFRREVADFLRFSDLFVLSSDWEGLPLSLIEALKMGTPVVSTDCRSGPRELLEDGRYGELVPVGDPQQLAAGVLRALDSAPAREAMMARAADFDVDAVARRYEALMFGQDAPAWRR
jgi:glycosyltransferase involved in cell wall biosynthesis